MKHRTRTVVARAIASAAVVLLAGCVADHDPPGDKSPTREGVTLVGSDPRILVVHDTARGMAAALTGRLFYDAANRCLTITDVGDLEPGTGVIPVWPSGTRPVIEKGKHGIDLPGDDPVLLEGESIKLGGGYVDWKTHPPSGLKIPNACIPDLANSMIFQLHPKQPIA